MICWRCHSNSINPGSRLPNISDVKTRKRRNMVEIDMIRNNRIDDLVLSRQDHSDFFNVLCWFGFSEFSSTRYYVSLVYICEIWKNGTVLSESASVTLRYFYLSRSIVGVFESLTTCFWTVDTAMHRYFVDIWRHLTPIAQKVHLSNLILSTSSLNEHDTKINWQMKVKLFRL
jgi:hypothetical protein